MSEITEGLVYWADGSVTPSAELSAGEAVELSNGHDEPAPDDRKSVV